MSIKTIESEIATKRARKFIEIMKSQNQSAFIQGMESDITIDGHFDLVDIFKQLALVYNRQG